MICDSLISMTLCSGFRNEGRAGNRLPDDSINFFSRVFSILPMVWVGNEIQTCFDCLIEMEPLNLEVNYESPERGEFVDGIQAKSAPANYRDNQAVESSIKREPVCSIRALILQHLLPGQRLTLQLGPVACCPLFSGSSSPSNTSPLALPSKYAVPAYIRRRRRPVYAFERAYAIRWLTALIAQLEARTMNTESNLPIQSDSGRRFQPETVPNILSTSFDVIFGADIVYEVQHAVWIRDCLKSLLSQPGCLNEGPVFHLVIPLRPTHTFESCTVEEVFGSGDRVLEGPQRGLTILSKESIICEAYGDGRVERSHADDDVEYVYFRIGWTR